MENGSSQESTELRESRLTIVTGPRGCGKTTWCTGRVEAMRSEGLPVDGVICPAVFVDGVRIAIDVITLGDGVRRRLAVSGRDKKSGFGERSWDFNPLAVREGEAYLAGLDYVTHLIIDEIGPLELFHGGGWQAGLRLLDGRGYETATVVVRSSLLGTATRRWPWAEIMDLGTEGDHSCC